MSAEYFQSSHYQPNLFLSSSCPESHHYQEASSMEHLKYFMQPPDSQFLSPSVSPAKNLSRLKALGRLPGLSFPSVHFPSLGSPALLSLLFCLLFHSASRVINSQTQFLHPCFHTSSQFLSKLQPLRLLFDSFYVLFSFLMSHCLRSVLIIHTSDTH